ncbi:hypothetical protein RQP46_001831 [Phenoliferia psychrophenolica]
MGCVIPDGITLVSFYCFTELAGRELTIPVAFTALALFQQVRQALTNVPQGIYGLLQARVSIERINAFLVEPFVHPLD